MFSERDRRRLQDIVDNAGRIADYVGGFNFERFRLDRMRTDAVERCLHRITEAVIQLGIEQTQEARLDVTWHEVRNLGNRLRHEYQRIDQRAIFDTAVTDIPSLRDAAVRALDRP